MRMDRRMRLGLSLLAAAMVPALDGRGLAQDATAAIRGTVRDYGSGADVGAVEVALSGATRLTVITGADGSYAFADPGTGTWQLGAATREPPFATVGAPIARTSWSS